MRYLFLIDIIYMVSDSEESGWVFYGILVIFLVLECRFLLKFIY